ncbi:MAG: hypothetical protein L0H64_15925 [Pseudonocardia sp.]|nr:hypothetical protein [Pseudonocardia sp.]
MVRVAWGGLLLIAPGAVLAVTIRSDPAFLGTARAVLRVLGARHLVQAGVELTAPRPAVLAVAAVVDGLHAASGLAYGALDPRWRRSALLDAAVAAGFCLSTVRSARHHRPEPS